MLNESRRAARSKIVEEHLRVENEHDLNGIMETFGEDPSFVLNDELHDGRESVRALYAELLHGFPDVRFDVKQQYVSDEVIIVEMVLSGTHTNAWRGIPATGLRMEVPLCAIFPFDENDKIAGERGYFDTALVLRQLGVLS